MKPTKHKAPAKETQRVVVAVQGADFHASDKPPTARSSEDDWLRTQAGYWRQAKALCDRHQVPFIGAGDWFDDGWRAGRCSPALINMVLRNMPDPSYGVPGQHDLPNHRLDQIRRSAFWTLVEAGKLTYLEPEKPAEVAGRTPLRLWGWPWGVPVQPLNDPHDLFLEVAVVHQFVWTRNTKHPGADPEGSLKKFIRRAIGYDLVVVGDNHKPFQRGRFWDPDMPAVWNCGAFTRRTVAEKDHRPRLGILYSDGTVEPHYLDVSKDRFIDAPEPEDSEAAPEGLDEFVEELKSLADRALDFREAVLRLLDRDGVTPGVRAAVLKCLEGK